MSFFNKAFSFLVGVPGADIADPFGSRARKHGLSDANTQINTAAKAYDTRTGSIDFNVTPDMVNQYMSPDVASRQNAATQALAQLYGNSGALQSSAAMSGIANTNANIAAQAWNDAFGRASGVVGQNNALALERAQAERDAAMGIAGNNASAAANQRGWFGTVGNAAGGVVGSILRKGA